MHSEPCEPIAISGSPIMITALSNIPSDAAVGAYSVTISVQDCQRHPQPLVDFAILLSRKKTVFQLAVTQTFSSAAPDLSQSAKNI